MGKTLRLVLVSIFLTGLVGMALFPRGVRSVGTIQVETTADELSPKDGNGLCSLREAIENANNDDQGYPDCEPGGARVDVIDLPVGEYTLELGGAGEDNNQEGDLDILDDLMINGHTTHTLASVIQAGSSSPVKATCADCIDRVLDIQAGVHVEINQVVMRYGRLPDAPPGSVTYAEQNGGGIYNLGSLTLNDCTVAENRAGDGATNPSEDGGRGGYGGGIYSSGDLTLNGTLVRVNRSGDGGDSAALGHGGSGGFGGGIHASAVLTLQESQVTKNQTGNGGDGGDHASAKAGNGGSGGRAGGVYCFGCTLMVEASTIDQNTTGNGGNGGEATGGDYDGGNAGWGGPGGGVYISDAAGAVFSNATLHANQTGGPGLSGGGSGSGGSGAVGYRGSGGGIYLNGGTNQIQGSTLDHNAALNGGGLYVDGTSTLETLNTTVSNNQADGGGGGMGVTGTSATELLHTTVAYNTADADGNGSGDGGGIQATAPITFTSTILAMNTDLGGSYHDCRGNAASGDYNLVGVADGCVVVQQANDLFGTAASPYPITLSALGDYGGPTETHPVQYPHDAINAIPVGVNGCWTTVFEDQRGVVRFNGCDMGAVEYDQGERTYLPVVFR